VALTCAIRARSLPHVPPRVAAALLVRPRNNFGGTDERIGPPHVCPRLLCLGSTPADGETRAVVNSGGEASVTIVQGSKIVHADFLPGQVYVRLDLGAFKTAPLTEVISRVISLPATLARLVESSAGRRTSNMTSRSVGEPGAVSDFLHFSTTIPLARRTHFKPTKGSCFSINRINSLPAVAIRWTERSSPRISVEVRLIRLPNLHAGVLWRKYCLAASRN
jgi:hypothetical protein